MSAGNLGALFLLGALWGASFLFIRVAVPAFGPVVMADLRVLLAGGVIAAGAALARRRWAPWPRWRSYLVLGAVNAAIPFVLIAFAALHLPASMLATFNATIPLFTALVAAAWLEETMTPRKVAGLLLGIAGVGVMVGWSPVPMSGEAAVAAGCMLLGCLCYAVGGVYAARMFLGAPPLELAVGQQLAAGALLLPFALVTMPSAAPSGRAVLALIALVGLSTVVGYLLYFWLIVSVGATKTHTVTFLVPGFGIAWGVIFLGETLSLGMVIGLGVVLVSIVLVAGVRVGDLAPSRRPRGMAGS